MMTDNNDNTRELAIKLADTDAAPELAEFQPSIVLESAVGPFVEYERTDAAEYVDTFIPTGWRASYADQIKLASGRYRAPLVHDDTAVQPLALQWGAWDVPASAPVAWGARAIYRIDHHESPTKRRNGRVIERAKSTTTATIDLLWDRQGSAARVTATNDERQALATWLNKTAMPALRRECAKHYITPDCNEVVEIERDGFKLIAGPRESHGYLYIRAWKVA